MLSLLRKISNCIGPGLWPQDVNNTGRLAFCGADAGLPPFCCAAGASDTGKRRSDKAMVVETTLEVLFMDVLRDLKPQMRANRRHEFLRSSAV
jgi:hypothetical protein